MNPKGVPIVEEKKRWKDEIAAVAVEAIHDKPLNKINLTK
jgi:hypothetical protein